MKVLIFSNDLMPFGDLPTSGGGLRAWQLMQGLQSRGIETVVSMPGFTFLAKKHFAQIPVEQKKLLWDFSNQDSILRSAKPDAVLFTSNWDHFALADTRGVPLIIDLHGSRLIETTMWDTPASSEKKVEILSKADCLLCAGMRQRMYFYGWLLQAGRVPNDEHFIRYIPISLSPELPVPKQELKTQNYPQFVSGGGWFPWQNQSTAIFEVCKSVAARNAGSVEIFGTPHERQGSNAEELQLFETFKQVSELSKSSPRIRVHGYIGRNELIEIYRGGTVALEAMRYNLERELAFTTRTIEYLWCGLPVIYNNYSEISEHIAEYDAGWTIDPTNVASISEVLNEIWTSPEKVLTKSQNAQSLVRDRFTWEKTIQPLIDYLEQPVKASPALSVGGTVYARPSFLNARGTPVEIPVGREFPAVSQRIIAPADNLSGLELYYSVPQDLNIEVARQQIKQVAISVHAVAESSDISGKLIASEALQSSAISTQGRVFVPFKFIRPVRGGEVLLVKILVEFEGLPSSGSQTAKQTLIQFRGLKESAYPALQPASFANRQVEFGALAIGFQPARETGIYRLRSLFNRFMQMVRQGQWSRIRRAILRRIPILFQKIFRTRLVRLQNS